MGSKSVFFAGGRTGGHIYPAVAVAEKILKIQSNADIHFFCSQRDIDSRILSKTKFSYTQLPAKKFSLFPTNFFRFLGSFFSSCKTAREKMAVTSNAVVVGVGGFVSAPVCWAAHKANIPVKLINVDIVPGKANKLLARFADEVFLQFEETAGYFSKRNVKANVVGCPLRSGFENPQPEKAKVALALDRQKKVLLITGASSGSQRINETICLLLEKLSDFANEWQIVHLTGPANYEQVKRSYSDAKIGHKILDYYDDMANLLAAGDLVIGRSGAVSVAEYAAAGTPSICMPYPYHSDMHQYFNTGKLVDAGAAIVVDDLEDKTDRTEWLWEELEPLLKNDDKRQQMKQACATIAEKDAALKIAELLLKN